MATDVVEGVSREIEPERAVVPVDEGLTGAGTFALANMSDADFSERLASLVKHRERIRQVQRALMQEGVHFGIIPGTDKPTLLLPGAELLADVYRLRARFDVRRTVGDGVDTPSLSYMTECYLHMGSLDGPVIAHASGAANSWEKRYRYRNAQRVCPNCGKPTVIKGKAEYGGGWLCWAKNGGCNSKWPDGAPEIEGQEVGQVENPDPFDLDVVLDAMANKRAFVHAVRRGCAVSDLFTSDLEDLPGNEPAPAPAQTAPAGSGKPAPAPAQAKPASGGLGSAPGGGFVGKVEVRNAPADLNLRQTPDGLSFGFGLVGEGNKGRLQVIAYEPIAQDLEGKVQDGQMVSVWGTEERIPWERDGKPMPPYRRLTLERIVGPGWEIPARDDELDNLPF